MRNCFWNFNPYVLTIILLLLFCEQSFAQNGEGDIQIGAAGNSTPDPGTIRYNADTKDFEGWNGERWLSLTRGGRQYGSVTDIEGYVYRTVIIGDQEWMVENLRTKRYRDGLLVTLTGSNSTWSLEDTIGRYSWYDNLESNESPYGKLYNWNTVNNSNGLCPTGWHVPTVEEWLELRDYLGGSAVAGGKMKEIGTEFWDPPNAFATNESGFAGLPGGYRTSAGNFVSKGENGYWWTSSEHPVNDGAYYFTIFDDRASSTNTTWFQFRFGLPVRCIRD